MVKKKPPYFLNGIYKNNAMVSSLIYPVFSSGFLGTIKFNS